MLSAAPASWLRVQNLAFTDNQVSAIYDWDSVALVPEPALVGSASVMRLRTRAAAVGLEASRGEDDRHPRRARVRRARAGPL
jgi:hypothetical protein